LFFLYLERNLPRFEVCLLSLSTLLLALFIFLNFPLLFHEDLDLFALLLVPSLYFLLLEL